MTRILTALLLVASTALARKTIRDDATGGDGSTIGIWNQATKTLTLTGNVTGDIVIASSGITFDGAGFTVSGPSTSPGRPDGIRTDAGLTNVTIKNTKVTGFTVGIALFPDCPDCTLEDNEFFQNGGGLLVDTGCHRATIQRNNLNGAVLLVKSSDDCRILSNTITNTTSTLGGISLDNCSRAVLRSNQATGNVLGISLRFGGTDNLIEDNVCNANGSGISVTADSVRTTIRGNIANGNTFEGIGTRGSLVLVENNTANGNQRTGMQFVQPGTGTIVRGNVANDNVSGGINGGFTGALVENNTANRNGSSSFGLRIVGSNNTVRANSVDQNPNGMILLGDDNIIEDNTALNASGSCIQVFGDRNQVRRNTLRGVAFIGLHVIGSDDIFEDNHASELINGIFIFVGARNVIRHNTLINNRVGLRLDGGGNTTSDCTVVGNTATGNSSFGLGIFGTGHLIENNTCDANSVGVKVSGTGHIVRNNEIRANGTGIELFASQSNTFQGNTITANTIAGIGVGVSTGNLFYDNLFNNAQNVTVSASAINTWNLARAPGPNIVGGPSIGGNFWGTPTGSGHSETCTDAGGDGFCDSPFVIDANNSDLLPLVLNTPPSCNPSGAGVYQLGSTITLGGTVADNEGDLVSFEWRSGATVLASGTVQTIVGGAPVALPSFSPTLGLGVHTLELVIDDGNILDPVVCEVIVEVIDTTDPTLAPVSDHSMLWPPNHQMVTCTVQANAADNDGLPPTLLVTVTSNEADNGLGDGDTPNDIQNLSWDNATGITTVALRAERSGAGTGRVYTITITATDSAGNSSMTSLTVVVPRSQGQGGN